MAGSTTKESSKEIEEARAQIEAPFIRDQFNKVRLNDDNLPDDFASAMQTLADSGITVESTADVIVDGFPEIDKAALVGRECIFLTWQLSRPESESFGQPFVVVRGITKDGQRFRFSDGSTGVFRQLVKITENRIENNSKTPNAGLHVLHGLTRSNYKVPHPTREGIEIEATTYYIASSRPAVASS